MLHASSQEKKNSILIDFLHNEYRPSRTSVEANKAI